ncbi:MAG TPA: hypothetical protein VM182_00585, partial [Terriglobia bacterium]|nr:hypothetical protein [Terriglobia bacterium]
MTRRPQVRNADGSISSVRSISVEIDGKEVLIPTVTEDAKIVSDEEAVAQYRKTGKHLGIFDTAENATRYAQAVHQSEARKLRGGPEPEFKRMPTMVKEPEGFDERHPVLSRVLDIFGPLGQRAAAVGEQVGEAVRDIPAAIAEPRAEEFTGADPYAETLQRINRSLQRGGRQTRNLATILFSPFSLLMAPVEGAVTPVVGTIQNLLKGVSTLDPGELEIREDMADRPFIEVLSTPGAVRTKNENLNAMLDEAGGLLPFVLAGGAIHRARAAAPGFRPMQPTVEELRGLPPEPRRAEAGPVTPPAEAPARPAVKPPILYTPEVLERMAREAEALERPEGPPPEAPRRAAEPEVRPAVVQPPPEPVAPRVARDMGIPEERPPEPAVPAPTLSEVEGALRAKFPQASEEQIQNSLRLIQRVKETMPPARRPSHAGVAPKEVRPSVEPKGEAPRVAEVPSPEPTKGALEVAAKPAEAPTESLHPRRAAAKAKEPWQETRKEVLDRLAGNAQMSLHRRAVARAFEEGKPVPPEVLKDYPELAKAEPTKLEAGRAKFEAAKAARAEVPAEPTKVFRPTARRRPKTLLSADRISDFQIGRDRVERRGAKTFVVDTSGEHAPIEVKHDAMEQAHIENLKKLNPAQLDRMEGEIRGTPYLSREGKTERLDVIASMRAGTEATRPPEAARAATEPKDVTTTRLAELEELNRYVEDRAIAKYSRKPRVLTGTEQAVLEKIPDAGIDLGFISKPLVYDPTLRQWSMAERKALNSLLSRGITKIVEVRGSEVSQGEKPTTTGVREFLVK